jgi:hypothetical protein
MLIFPEISEPTITGGSYTEDFKDSTISTTTDANYTVTRPRATRMPGVWTFTWVAMPYDDYYKFIEFYKKVGKSEKFIWVNPIDLKQYIVRITEKGKWQWLPYGWQGSVTFEEV